MMYDKGGIIASAQRRAPQEPVRASTLGNGLAAQQVQKQGQLSIEEQLSMLPPEQRAIAVQDLLQQNEMYMRGDLR